MPDIQHSWISWPLFEYPCFVVHFVSHLYYFLYDGVSWDSPVCDSGIPGDQSVEWIDRKINVNFIIHFFLTHYFSMHGFLWKNPCQHCEAAASWGNDLYPLYTCFLLILNAALVQENPNKWPCILLSVVCHRSCFGFGLLTGQPWRTDL